MKHRQQRRWDAPDGVEPTRLSSDSGRRHLLITLPGGAAAWPPAVRVQQAPVPLDKCYRSTTISLPGVRRTIRVADTYEPIKAARCDCSGSSWHFSGISGTETEAPRLAALVRKPLRRLWAPKTPGIALNDVGDAPGAEALGRNFARHRTKQRSLGNSLERRPRASG
jgi:hypothetical protein